MTLIVASKLNGKFLLSSDSRLTINSKENLFTDKCVKIYSIPVKIIVKKFTNEGVKQETSLIYEKKWCMAMAGSFYTSLMIKNLMSELLSSIAIVDGGHSFKFEDICNYILNLFKSVSKSMLPILREGGTCIFFIGGFDPEIKKLRTFLFYHKIVDGFYQPYYEEAPVKENKYLSFGSGVATMIKHGNLNSGVFNSLKNIVNDKTDSSIGGKVQYGYFNKNNDFEILRILEGFVDMDGKKMPIASFLSFDFGSDKLIHGKFCPGHYGMMANELDKK